MHAVDPDLDAPTRRRWKRLGVLSIAALLLHAAALGGLDWGWPSRDAPLLPAAAMQVRVVEVALPAEPPAVAPAARIEAVVPVVAPPPRLAVARAKLPAPRPAVPTLVAAAPTVDPSALPIEVAAVTAPVAHPETAPALVVPVDEAIPHYRTRIPPAITLRYEMQRGLLSGTGDLAWRPQGERYELKLEARVAGVSVLTQISAGGFDAAGIAPVRFTDQRLRRGTAAANFQRAAAKITFSGPGTEFALRDGAQDRLSWMVQLGAIVAAEPQFGQPGAKVAMYVVGSHGDAGVWVFRCLGPEAVATGAGTITAIKFAREPREAYDTTVQVWLDPKQHHLPVRALQQSGSNDEPFDLRLREVVTLN